MPITINGNEITPANEVEVEVEDDTFIFRLNSMMRDDIPSDGNSQSGSLMADNNTELGSPTNHPDVALVDALRAAHELLDWQEENQQRRETYIIMFGMTLGAAAVFAGGFIASLWPLTW